MKRAKQIQKRIEELATCSEDEFCISRIFGTKSFLECSNKIAGWMKAAGLQTHVDNMGNIRGKLLSKNPGAKTFVMGSHFDTVINAGKYDGILGILTGLDIIENIIENAVSLPFHIEVIAFSEEEGVRFHVPYLGSRVIAGDFNNKMLGLTDENGNSLSQVLESIACNSNLLIKDAILPGEWLGYLEIHIEQGPVLFEKNIPVGIVSAIAGQKRIEITFTGEAGHAGTIPMGMRHDALCAAALFILEVEKYATIKKNDMVATVGKLNILHSAGNVIPGKVSCTLDIRSADTHILSESFVKIHEIGESICSKRKIHFEWKPVQEADPVVCNEKLKTLLSHSIKHNNIELIELVSGAGHDAVVISKVAPVAMLFVKCFKGISHNPLENVEIEDIAKVLKVSDYFIEQLASQVVL